MSPLRLSIAMGNYDRTRALVDGEVRVDGADPIYLMLSPEEMFFRSFRDVAFDVSELSLSTFALKTADGSNPYVGIPVFPSRAFRHTSIHVRSDRGIESPADLEGRRLGTPEYQLTACVWARALLQDEYGVAPSDVIWVRGGMEQGGRREKIPLRLPSGIRIEEAPDDRTLSQMLERGDIDGIVGPRAPSCFERGHPHVRRLFADPSRAAAEYFQRTRIFPIMHVLGVRRDLAERHPWVPMALYKAFSAAKDIALERLTDTSATKVTLPFVEEQLRAARALMGQDFWSYGAGPNHHVLDKFLHHHHAQGLSQRRLQVGELFHPSTLESFKI
ncbi:MAG: ABC transporter substrate-binding protein [Gammaproteobacteria bacterium]|nr:ABC transporter substrate-binding protein [Gammaproteobacteria bacterium]